MEPCVWSVLMDCKRCTVLRTIEMGGIVVGSNTQKDEIEIVEKLSRINGKLRTICVRRRRRPPDGPGIRGPTTTVRLRPKSVQLTVPAPI